MRRYDGEDSVPERDLRYGRRGLYLGVAFPGYGVREVYEDRLWGEGAGMAGVGGDEGLNLGLRMGIESESSSMLSSSGLADVQHAHGFVAHQNQ